MLLAWIFSACTLFIRQKIVGGCAVYGKKRDIFGVCKHTLPAKLLTICWRTSLRLACSKHTLTNCCLAHSKHAATNFSICLECTNKNKTSHIWPQCKKHFISAPKSPTKRGFIGEKIARIQAIVISYLGTFKRMPSMFWRKFISVFEIYL